MKAELETIEINGQKNVRAESVPTPVPNGNRAMVVVDRGWIFAGDVTEENGRVYLDRAIWVFGWKSIGLDGVLADPLGEKSMLRPLSHRVDIPAGSEIYRIPVADDWGLR